MNVAAAAESLRGAPIAVLAAEALDEPDAAWIVGGAVRDALLGVEIDDLDIAIAADPREAALAMARLGQGHAFELSAEFATWRAAREGEWQIDLTSLRGGSIEADLAGRDFTIGAVAVPLAGGGPLDPHSGVADLDARILRVVGPESFSEDPLRLLRAARLGAELGLRVEPETLDLARAGAARAGDPAGERQLTELGLLLTGPDPLRGLELLDEFRITPVVLPEVEAMRGVGQNQNHHLDVFGHTIAVLASWLEIEGDLDAYVGDRAGEVRSLLEEPLADGLTRGGALRFAALLHDAGKPATRVAGDGIVTFMGHDRVGAEIVESLCRRLRASRRLSRHLSALTLHHLRLGFMVRERPLPPRRVHNYLRATEPVSVDVTLLTIADRLSARGGGPVASDAMVEAHLEVAREMVGAGLDFRRDGPPAPLLRGDELAAELGIEPGPALGELLAELEAARYAGEIQTRAEAIDHVRHISSAP